MFTVEFDADATIITTLDGTGKFEDVQVIQDGEHAYIRQWNEPENSYQLIILTIKQFKSILAAQSVGAGSYEVEFNNG